MVFRGILMWAGRGRNYDNGNSVNLISKEAKIFSDLRRMIPERECGMVNRFDRIVIPVPDLRAAAKEYQQLLGVASSEPPVAQGDSPVVWLPLPNTVIELVEFAEGPAFVGGIVFVSAESPAQDEVVANARGLDIRLCDGARTSAIRARQQESADTELRVDHLVLRTANAAECIDLFGRQLGIRLALDQTVPEWGGRMLFFRTGKVTLEVIEPQRKKPDADNFWGIAYQCKDLEQTAAQLAARGITLSEIRPGRKQGSIVATVKSHCLGIPTLLIQHG
jgi:catechol 2,3-dioxygenase-like lactoylglutathione lyase family enzyme